MLSTTELKVLSEGVKSANCPGATKIEGYSLVCQYFSMWPDPRHHWTFLSFLWQRIHPYQGVTQRRDWWWTSGEVAPALSSVTKLLFHLCIALGTPGLTFPIWISKTGSSVMSIALSKCEQLQFYEL